MDKKYSCIFVGIGFFFPLWWPCLCWCSLTTRLQGSNGGRIDWRDCVYNFYARALSVLDGFFPSPSQFIEVMSQGEVEGSEHAHTAVTLSYAILQKTPLT